MPIFILIASCHSVGKQTKDSSGGKIVDDRSGGILPPYEIAIDNFLDGWEIWVPKNQTIAQSLSIIVKTDTDELIIFDGGRKEDAEYLHDFITENGGVVRAWFLTHIHDDHVGALYEILDKYDDVYIWNLCYNFADFDFYFETEGNDAGIVLLLKQKFYEYANSHKFMKLDEKVKRGQKFKFGNIENPVEIEVMNDLYEVDDDRVNNSSIVYKVSKNGKSMIVLGDLAYEGGIKLLNDKEKDLKSDIVVMAHHGQAGVGEDVYKAINPSVAIWPTTEKLYLNEENKYSTDDTKRWLSDIGVKYNILSYKNTYVIK